MTGPAEEHWSCEAYGPDIEALGALCFVAGKLPARVCESRAVCEQTMAAERQRVFRRINELAATTADPTWAMLESEFARPEQLLGGDEDDPER